LKEEQDRQREVQDEQRRQEEKQQQRKHVEEEQRGQQREEEQRRRQRGNRRPSWWEHLMEEMVAEHADFPMKKLEPRRAIRFRLNSKGLSCGNHLLGVFQKELASRTGKAAPQPGGQCKEEAPPEQQGRE
jgi:hypothetical protein